MLKNFFRALLVAWLLPLAVVADLGCNDSASGPHPAAPADRTAGPEVSQTDARLALQDPDQESPLPARVPAKVGRVLQYIDEHDSAPDGHEGGRSFGNYEGLLAKKDARGRIIRYREWDVNRKVPGKNRGPQRLVTGSDGSAYYSGDHYKTFIKIR
jgi:ribonuclease T1